jgi:hypothetical protein
MASTLTFLTPATVSVGHTAPDADDDVPTAAHRPRTDAATTYSPPADAHALRIPRCHNAIAIIAKAADSSHLKYHPASAAAGPHNGNDNYIRIRTLRQCPRLRNPDLR